MMRVAAAAGAVRCARGRARPEGTHTKIVFAVSTILRLKVVKVRRWKDFQNLGGVPCHGMGNARPL